MKEDLQKTFSIWEETYYGYNKKCYSNKKDYTIHETHYVRDQEGKRRKISAVVANSIYLKGILLSP